MTRVTKRLEATAYHEAGHAVVRFLVQLSFREVTIVPTDDTLGCISGGRVLNDFHPDWDDSPRVKSHLERHILSRYGGPLAERRFARQQGHRWQRNLSQGDCNQALDLAGYLPMGSMKETEAYLNWLWVRVEAMLEHHWAAVEALAKELLAHRRVGYRRARQIIKEAITGGKS